MDPQLKRGIPEVCVLKALQKEDSYGYRIIKDLSPAVSLSESTLYPILKRMEQSGCITEYSVAHNGRLRNRLDDLPPEDWTALRPFIWTPSPNAWRPMWAASQAPCGDLKQITEST